MSNVHPIFEPILNSLHPIDTTELDKSVESLEEMKRQRISDEFDQWVTDITRVKDAGPELLKVLRKICGAGTGIDMVAAIHEGRQLVKKLPEL